MNDDELKQHMNDLAYQGDKARKFALDMIGDEMNRLRQQIDNLRTERDNLRTEREALNAIIDRLVEEIVDMENKLPFTIVRRWVRFVRSGWRV